MKSTAAESACAVQFIELNGTRLEYCWHGPAPDRKPTMVFLHGGLASRGLWLDFPQSVAEATGLGALVYSRAGYGQSSPIALPRPLTHMHDEALFVLPQVLSALGIQEHVLVGHSDGASIAIIAAGADVLPGLRAAVTIAPHVFVEEVTLRSAEAARDAFVNGDLREALRRWHGNNTDCAFWGWSGPALDPKFQNFNITEYLGRISVPILVVQGTEDAYGTLAQVRAIEQGANADVETLVIPGCGHEVVREGRESALQVMAAFIRRTCS